ncbi:HVA22-like protein f [Forsythia ovata]|uniref:HVA22-like protein f n=1 Tax=Forsythia ovata TaxID=205694 RepID=A0ABD1S7J8_9LAMI
MGFLRIIFRTLLSLAGFPLWPYIKILICLWLNLPKFNGATFIYQKVVRKYVNVGTKARSNKAGGQPKVLQMMKPDTIKTVESYIQKYGPEAFDRVIKGHNKPHLRTIRAIQAEAGVGGKQNRVWEQSSCIKRSIRRTWM